VTHSGPEVLFQDLVAMKFVDDDDDDGTTSPPPVYHPALSLHSSNEPGELSQ